MKTNYIKMGLIERLKDFLNAKPDKPTLKDLTPENIYQIYDNPIFGDDPYYWLNGHHIAFPPLHKDLYKFWIYDGKTKKKSEWEKLGFEIRDFNPFKEGYDTDGNKVTTYYFRPISKELAEEWEISYKDHLNAYEKIQQEKDSNKITSELTRDEIEFQSENIIESLNFVSSWRDLRDIKQQYNSIKYCLKYLIFFENCDNFFEYSELKEKPSSILEKLDNYETYLMKCIENEHKYTIEKVSKIKNKQGKINTLNRYFIKLNGCRADLTKVENNQRHNAMVNEVKALFG